MSQNSPTPLSCQSAWNMLDGNNHAILIDIRSTMEFLFVGHPTGAAHIPWIDEPDWTVNPDFVAEVQKLIQHKSQKSGETVSQVVLICRSGKRSLHAGKALIEAGMQHIYHVEEGFEGELDEYHRRSTIGGWRYHDLPWEQC